MGTTYSVNQFDEVVPCYDGRTSNSTTDRRYTTDFEKQLLEEIKELKIELEEAKANPVENRVMPKIAEAYSAMAYLFDGGEFSYWLNEQEIPLAAIKEYEEAKEWFDKNIKSNFSA